MHSVSVLSPQCYVNIDTGLKTCMLADVLGFPTRTPTAKWNVSTRSVWVSLAFGLAFVAVTSGCLCCCGTTDLLCAG